MRHFTGAPKDSFSYDLHVLSAPLTFVLSQDQTLQLNSEGLKNVPQPKLLSKLGSNWVDILPHAIANCPTFICWPYDHHSKILQRVTAQSEPTSTLLLRF